MYPFLTTTTTILVALVCCSHMSSGVLSLPLDVVVETRETAPPPQKNTSCLNANQTRELREAITGIQATLDTAVVALDIASAADSDPKVKQQLKEAARDIQVVSRVLVANLTNIVESACGTCSQIVADVNETVAVIEETIGDIEPAWKNTTAFKAVTAALNLIAGLAQEICPSSSTTSVSQLPEMQADYHHQRRTTTTAAAAAAATTVITTLHSSINIMNPTNESCLNATQIDEVRKAVAGIRIALDTADIALEIAARAETDNKTKANLLLAAKVVAAVNQDIVGNLTKILTEPCSTCSQIVDIISASITSLEQTLTKIEPSWKSDPLFKDIVAAINQILELVKVICPSTSGGNMDRAAVAADSSAAALSADAAVAPTALE